MLTVQFKSDSPKSGLLALAVITQTRSAISQGESLRTSTGLLPSHLLVWVANFTADGALFQYR